MLLLFSELWAFNSHFRMISDPIPEKTQSDLTQLALSEQIQGIQKFFEPDPSEEDGEMDGGDNIVTYKQFMVLENKVDQLFAAHTRRNCVPLRLACLVVVAR